MKEKVRHLLQYLHTWKFVVHLNLVFVASNIVHLFVGFHAAYIAGLLFHLGVAMMGWFLFRYEIRYQSDQFQRFILHDRWVHAHNRVVIYRRHFGDLTPEMEKELAEGERMAIEEETEKKEEKKEEKP